MRKVPGFFLGFGAACGVIVSFDAVLPTECVVMLWVVIARPFEAFIMEKVRRNVFGFLVLALLAA